MRNASALLALVALILALQAALASDTETTGFLVAAGAGTFSALWVGLLALYYDRRDK